MFTIVKTCSGGKHVPWGGGYLFPLVPLQTTWLFEILHNLLCVWISCPHNEKTDSLVDFRWLGWILTLVALTFYVLEGTIPLDTLRFLLMEWCLFWLTGPVFGSHRAVSWGLLSVVSAERADSGQDVEFSGKTRGQSEEVGLRRENIFPFSLPQLLWCRHF